MMSDQESSSMSQSPAHEAELLAEMRAEVSEVVKRVWGFESLRPHQEAPVMDLALGKHIVAMMPTGGGKSLCFQLPAIVRGGLCIVITPLIALMKDQCSQLKALGVKAEAWTGNNGDRILDNVRFGNVQFLYMSPERIGHPMFQARHGFWDVRTIIVDEAHCISQWGHDFRPAFQRIGELKGMFPQAVWGCFTATATEEVLKDIGSNLPEAAIHAMPMRRKNLAFQVSTWGDRDSEILNSIRHLKGKGLIYVRTRHEAERWGNLMRQVGMSAATFHAGMTQQSKDKTQRKWLSGECQALACTSAFGMGIDAPDVGWVVHAGPPPNLESYIQEAGRAGRDGRHAHCLLFVGEHDMAKLRERLDAQFPDNAIVQAAYQGLANAGSVAIGEQPNEPTPICRPEWNAAFDLLEQGGMIQSVPHPGDLRGSIRLNPRPASEPIPNHLVRLHNWIVAQPTTKDIQLNQIVTEGVVANIPTAVEQLNALDTLGRLDWTPQEVRHYAWTQPRMATNKVAVNRSRKQVLLDKLQLVERYITHEGCRASFLDGVFEVQSVDSSEPIQPCGICDACTADRNRMREQLQHMLQLEAHTSDSLIRSQAPGHRGMARAILQAWYRAGVIESSEHRIRWRR